MDAAELGRRRAAELHDAAVAKGHDPASPYAFVLAEAKRRGLDVEKAKPGAAILDGGRATYIATEALILHEDVGSEFDQAFLVAHELGHVELGDEPGPIVVTHVDPARPAEPAPVGFDRVVDYGRRQRREVQMDLFAREFLLPRPVLRRLHVENGKTASEVATMFAAPFEVVCQQLLDALLLPTQPIEPEEPRAELPLNELQEKAARHRGEAYLLEAGPGTGKTQTLVGRVESLLSEGVDPRRILVLTFSNKAAGEMADRIAAKNPAAAAAIWIGTFHAFGLDVVRRFGPQLGVATEPHMMDRSEAVELLETQFPRLPLKHFRNFYDPVRNIADILSAVSRAKDEVVGPGEYAALAASTLVKATDADATKEAERAAEVAVVYGAYERLKSEANRIDFGDLVSMPVRLLETDAEVRASLQGTYDHVLVDEYQDVNRSSVRLIEALCPDGVNLWAVGDVKQSIYRFRGASSFNVERFGAEDFKGAARGRLKRNYRSSKEIVDGFSAFAATMKVAAGDVALVADRGPSGHPPELRRVERPDLQSAAVAESIEAMKSAGFAFRDQAVLCTGNERLSSIGRDLELAGIPVLYLGSLFERPEVKDLLSLLSLFVDSRAMGIVRLCASPPFELSLADVGTVLEALRGAGPEEKGWADFNPEKLGRNVRDVWMRLRETLAGFDETSEPWDVLARFLLDRTRLAGEVATADSVAARSRGIAMWQFMNFVRVQPAGRGLRIKRLLDRVRRLVRIGDDRDLRQIPAAAQGLDAVRLMTLHGAKGLEFPVVHVPALNRDTLPGYPKPPACLPPDGMIAGARGSALEVFKAGDAAERECLFYVAASRARDRLFFYAVDRTASGAAKPLSPFLDGFGPGLKRVTTAPARSLEPAGKFDAVELVIEGGLSFTGPQIALYESCARRFFYTHVLRVGGKRTETFYMRLHEAVRSVTQAAIAGAIDLADERALSDHVDKACAEHGLTDSGVLEELRSAAEEMVRYFRSSRPGARTGAPNTLRLTIDRDEVLCIPDDVLVARDGADIFRRVRTGHIRSKEADDVGAAALVLAARGHDARARVELVHLSDKKITPVEMTPTVSRNRSQKLSGILAAIRGGAFPPDPSERTCPSCPAFFICGPVSKGPLKINS